MKIRFNLDEWLLWDDRKDKYNDVFEVPKEKVQEWRRVKKDLNRIQNWLNKCIRAQQDERRRKDMIDHPERYVSHEESTKQKNLRVWEESNRRFPKNEVNFQIYGDGEQ